MTRAAKFTTEQILDAALRTMADGGPGATTIAAIGEQLGAPVGSIYHRFKSRDLIMAQLWIRTIRRFQRGFIDALTADDLDAAALGAVQYHLRWSREHFDEARVLVLYRRQDLAARWPEELGDDLATLNTAVESALQNYAQRRYGEAGGAAMQRVTYALVDVPYAAVRRYLLMGECPPPSVDDLVIVACRCVLSVGSA